MGSPLSKEVSSRPASAAAFSEGPSLADVMLVGQNPGKEEVKQGRPFVGRSGKFLDMILEESGLKRDELYITSVVKEPTPGNKRPNAKQIEYWIPYLLAEIEKVKPKIIVLMGQVAWKTPRLAGIQYFETYHPAAAMRFPSPRQRFREDFRRLGQELARIHASTTED